jgi:DNA (cytosine-5)-methyltransferase 1
LYTVLDLFSGCGGLSLGLEQAGFHIKLGIDHWQDALDTFELNHKNSQTYCADLSDVDFDFVERRYLPGGVDIIIGGPPCQGFSISGKRDPNDPRNKLYQSFVQAVTYFRPKAFLMENVPNLASMSNGLIKQTIISEFESLGYHTFSEKLLASDYGVPQSRRRFFLIGFLDSCDFKFPEKTHQNECVTTAQAISDLPEHSLKNGADYPSACHSVYQEFIRVGSTGVYNHEITDHSEKTRSIISLVPDGGNYKDLPEEYRNTRNVNIAWTRYSSNKPSFTIDTGHRHHFHYKWNRVPTVRESARLQSFPDNFIFTKSKTSQYKQVGNAVPPLLAKKIGQSILKALNKN